MSRRAAPATLAPRQDVGPPGGLVLLGPMLTERAFARRAHLTPLAVRHHRCIPRVGCPFGIGAAYPAFMLDAAGLRLDVAFVTLLLRRRVTDLEACDWLCRRNPALADMTPLAWLALGESVDAVVAVLPRPTRPVPRGAPSEDAAAVREEWLRFRGEEETPGWTIAWDRLARRTPATPHGV